MNTERDYADAEVSGLERYFPTKISRVLLITLLTAPIGSFWVIIQNASQLMPNESSLFQNLVAICVALAVAVFTLLALVLDLTLVANQAKHRKIRHMSNTHPQMSFSWLRENAEPKHYIFLLVIFALGVICGQYL